MAAGAVRVSRRARPNGLAVELTGLLALLAAAYLLFRPLAAPRDLPDPELRRAAASSSASTAHDTLSFFKLRGDKQYLFNPERTAFLGYRIESGVLMISGDPVGEPESVESLMPVVVRFAEQRALRLAALGVSAEGRALFEQAGLRALYIGDEAIVDTERFSLEGRAIRKVRQSVSRLRNAGYRTELAALGSLDDAVVERLEQVAHDWLQGAPERGFSMAMDSLRNPQGEQTLVVYASDADGAIRGFLHFVPTYGRRAVSLSFMRRQPDTPNGLTEFMIVEAIEHLRARGVAEVSLNFAAFARLIREPARAARARARAPPRARRHRGSRSSGSTASTRSSSRAGSRATSCTSAASACREPGSPRSGSKGNSRDRRRAAGTAPRAPKRGLSCPGPHRVGDEPADSAKSLGRRPDRAQNSWRRCESLTRSASTALAHARARELEPGGGRADVCQPRKVVPSRLPRRPRLEQLAIDARHTVVAPAAGDRGPSSAASPVSARRSSASSYGGTSSGGRTGKSALHLPPHLRGEARKAGCGGAESDRPPRRF